MNAANKERGSGGGNFREMETTIHTNNILLYPSPGENRGKLMALPLLVPFPPNPFMMNVKAKLPS